MYDDKQKAELNAKFMYHDRIIIKDANSILAYAQACTGQTLNTGLQMTLKEIFESFLADQKSLHEKYQKELDAKVKSSHNWIHYVRARDRRDTIWKNAHEYHSGRGTKGLFVAVGVILASIGLSIVCLGATAIVRARSGLEDSF